VPVDESTACKVADMNSDGNLNIADVIAIVNDILGLPPAKPILSAPTQPGIRMNIEGNGLIAGLQHDPSLITQGLSV